MIVSKSALQVVNVTTVDKAVPVLDTVHIEMDGTVVGSNREGTVIVSPVLDKIRKHIPLQEGDSQDACTLPSSAVRESIKFIGVDKKFKGLLEHCDIVKTEKGEAQISCVDGTRSRAIQTKAYPKNYFDYKTLAKRVFSKRSKNKVVLNRKRFLSVLNCIEKICSDGSDFSSVFLEFTDENDVIIRGVNGRTGQRVVGICRGFKTDKWLDVDEWEKGIFDVHTEKKEKYIRPRKSKNL